MWTFIWFLVGLATGLVFATTLAVSSPLQLHPQPPSTAAGVTSKAQKPSSSTNTSSANRSKKNTVGDDGDDKTQDQAVEGKRAASRPQRQPPEQPAQELRQRQKQRRNVTEASVGETAVTTVAVDKASGTAIATTTAATVDTAARLRCLKLAESDPLFAAQFNVDSPSKKLTTKKSRSIKGSLRKRHAAAIAAKSKGGIDAMFNSNNYNYNNIEYSISSPWEARSKMAKTTATTTTVQRASAMTDLDPIPMDAESRWRDHHMKRQWAQTLILESLEPPLSRHLRHAIKAVLHFTSVGPETMDLRMTSRGKGTWDSLMTPILLPPSRTPLRDVSVEAQQQPRIQQLQVNGGIIRPRALSKSYTADPTMSPKVINIVSSALSPLEAPLAVESSLSLLSSPHSSKSNSNINNVSKPVRPTLLRSTSTSQHNMMDDDEKSPTSPPVSPNQVIIRGFVSSSSSHYARQRTRSTTALEEGTAATSPMKTTVRERHVSTSSISQSSFHRSRMSDEQGIHAKALNSPELSPTTPNFKTTRDDSVDISLPRIGFFSTGVPQQLNISESHAHTGGHHQYQQQQQQQQQHQQLPPASRSSRLWTRMRRVVQGDFKQQGGSPEAPSRNTVYMTAGSVAGSGLSTAAATRTMSHAQLASRPISPSPIVSSNLAMPSLSSSALSLLKEDQMSTEAGPTIVTSLSILGSPTRGGIASAGATVTPGSMTFETPPETAVNSPSPVSTSSPPRSPISPSFHARLRSGHQDPNSHHLHRHSIPGLARKSSTKSPVAVAEVTPAESRVSRFMYSSTSPPPPSPPQHLHLEPPVQKQQDIFSMPNALERATLAMAVLQVSNPTESINKSDKSNYGDDDSVRVTSVSSPRTPTPGNPFGLSLAASDATHRQGKDPQHQDFDQFLSSNSPPPPTAPTQEESEAWTTISLNQPPTVDPVRDLLSTAPSGDNSTLPIAVSSSVPSGSTLFSPPLPQLLAVTKEERRRSATSFGGYFSNLSEATRRSSRYLMMNLSTSEVETASASVSVASGNKGISVTPAGAATTTAPGEVIHMRRTSFVDKQLSPLLSPPSSSVLSSSPPAMASLASLLQTGRGLSRSQSMAEHRGSPKATGAQQQNSYHSRPVSEVSLPGNDASRHYLAGLGSGLSATATTNDPPPQPMTRAAVAAAKRRVTPLKITPLLLSGLSSMPSPKFLGPLPSASIPRPIITSMPSSMMMSGTGAAGAVAPPLHLDRYFFTAEQTHEWNIPSYGRVKLTDHAPLVFQAIRQQFNYSLEDMDEALSQAMTVMRTPGKSDAIFFASHNHGRFLLKTLRGAEPDNLKGFLGDYWNHLQKFPNTLLPRYLGMYTFERLSGGKILNGDGVASVVSPPHPTGLESIAISTSHSTSSSHHGDGFLRGDHGAGSMMGSKSDATAAQHLHLNGTLLSGKDDGLPSKLVVVVLANVFDTPEVVHERYDFKGSNVGRRTLPMHRVSSTSTLATTATAVPTATATRDKTVGGDGAPDTLLSTTELARRSSEMDFVTRPIQDATGRRSRDFQQDVSKENRASIMSSISLQYDQPSRQQQQQQQQQLQQQARAEVDDISQLTLKEMDFQNRVLTGETRLIQLGTSRRSEVLLQLQEDTALLRKHGFMDYSLLVGIRIVPKIPPKSQEQQHQQHEQQDVSSPLTEPCRRGSMSPSSQRSEATGDDSHAELSEDEDQDEEDGDNVNDIDSDYDSKAAKAMTTRSTDMTFNRILQMTGLAQAFNDQQRMFLKTLSNNVQATLQDLYSFGEGVVESVTSTNTITGERLQKKTQEEQQHQQQMPLEVELGSVRSVNSKRRSFSSASKRDGKKKNDREDKGKRSSMTKEELFDPESFQTVRYKSRSGAATTTTILGRATDKHHGHRRHGSKQRLFQELDDGEDAKRAPTTTAVETSSKQQASSATTTPFNTDNQTSQHQHSRQQQQHYEQDQSQSIIWSKGIPSLPVPDGFEAVYYFGLIDILQKYNLVKWLERNIKGANVRLLGATPVATPITANPPSSSFFGPVSGGPSGATAAPTTTTGSAAAHPGRVPSSFSASSLYQLLPRATASEPSLPTALESSSLSVDHHNHHLAVNPTLSVLMEDPASRTVSPSSSMERLAIPLATPLATTATVTTARTRTSLDDPNMPLTEDKGGLWISHSPSASTSSMFSNVSVATAATSVAGGISKSRLSSSMPFTKSLLSSSSLSSPSSNGTNGSSSNSSSRLSQYSHHSQASQQSHGSQPSQHSLHSHHANGRSRDSRLSFEIRESDSSGPSSSSTPPPPPSLLSISPPSAVNIEQQQQQQQQQKVPLRYPISQNAEVSVEEPGRYAERLVEFMRGIIV
ncbi:Phosphatidylinositol 4-phosphate 5-kinase 9 [Mortierella claussenii]|nr:Phosphatidylinositol 4-phosphate 5-kinase 9 [Mortierella claussenii]